MGLWLKLLLVGSLQPCVSEDPPNVVLIISDDQAWTDFGFMDHPVIETPWLDALAEESMVFPRGYVPTALCRASLATIITGLYADPNHAISTARCCAIISTGIVVCIIAIITGFDAYLHKSVAARCGPTVCQTPIITQ